jgi:hypothetical protein
LERLGEESGAEQHETTEYHLDASADLQSPGQQHQAEDGYGHHAQRSSQTAAEHRPGPCASGPEDRLRRRVEQRDGGYAHLIRL